jgi:polysaccharide pyruvyl transferase WcaK-like protein
MKTSLKRIGILGHVGNGNLGDEAIIAAVIQNLRECCPEAEICGFTTNPEDTEQRHRIRSFPLRRMVSRPSKPEAVVSSAQAPAEHSLHLQQLKRLAQRAPFIYSRMKTVRDFVSSIPGVLRELPFLIECYRRVEALDLLIIAGSQQLNDFVGVGGPWAFPYTVLKWTLLARGSGVRVVIFSVGAGPVRTRLGRQFIRWILALAGYRSFRDEYSRKVLAEMKVAGDNPFVPDLAFSLATEQLKPPPDVTRPVVGINPLPFFVKGYWHEIDPNYPRLYSEFVTKIAALAEFVIDQGYDVWLFPTQVRIDPSVIEDVRSRMSPQRQSHLINRVVGTLDDLMAGINGCRFVVASRYHGILLSLMSKKPVLALAYHEKSRDLMALLGQERFVLNTGSCDIEGLKRCFSELEREADQAETEIGLRLPAVQRAVARQYDVVFGESIFISEMEGRGVITNNN